MKLSLVALIAILLAVSHAIDVIVIGAGPSGIGAAQKLLEQNGNKKYTVTILEARNRIGGRVWTDRSTGFASDMGASWIHGPGNGECSGGPKQTSYTKCVCAKNPCENPITELANRYEIYRAWTDDNSLQMYNNAFSPIEDPPKGAWSAVKKGIKEYQTMEDAKEVPVDIALGEFLKSKYPKELNQPEIQYTLGSSYEFNYGTSIERLSTLYYDSDAKFPGKDVLMPNGYDKIFEGVINQHKIDIKFSHVVTKIDYKNPDNKIVVVASDLTAGPVSFTADYVIVTVPLGVLKDSKAISFAPPLPDEKTAAIKRLGMGSTNKIFMYWDKSIVLPWSTDDPQQYYGYQSAVNAKEGENVRGKYCYFLNLNKIGLNGILGFGFGKFGYDMNKMSDSDILTGVVEELNKIFKSNLPAPNSYVISRWGADPYAKGAYSYAKVGSLPTDFATVQKSVNGNLFFAGEHTIKKYRGTVHGAWLSGIKAAEEVVARPTPALRG